MKKHFAILGTLLLTSSFALSQQPNQGATPQAPAAPQPSGVQVEGGAAAQTGVQSQQPAQGQFRNTTQSDVSGREGTIFNQPAGANQPQPAPLGGTNQIRFGTTNQVQFGGTNPVQFGATNRGFAVGTNILPGDQFNEAAGAATNQLQGGVTNLADQAFSQQMRAVLGRPGAAQIYFPQTRSTITVVNQNGALTLQGVVTSDEERRSIEARIQNTPGVVSIDNQLQVGGADNQGITPRTPGINPAPNSQINPEQRRLLNP